MKSKMWIIVYFMKLSYIFYFITLCLTLNTCQNSRIVVFDWRHRLVACGNQIWVSVRKVDTWSQWYMQKVFMLLGTLNKMSGSLSRDLKPECKKLLWHHRPVIYMSRRRGDLQYLRHEDALETVLRRASFSSGTVRSVCLFSTTCEFHCV
jgi:hypothetical protein